MRYSGDERIVMTLDAGGTNFVFGAMQEEKEIVDPVRASAKGDKLETILQNMIKGFQEVRSRLSRDPVAISFAFPGPADYENGIIGDLQNLPLFRGGVALKAMLEDEFRVPTYINNDGDLFTYGEAIAGLLPKINALLHENGSGKKYRNLLGVTFGTGFGGGIVRDGQLFFGDNSAGGEINRMRNFVHPQTSVEDSVSIRAIRRVYGCEAGIELQKVPEPEKIFQIARGNEEGDRNAALKAFEQFAIVAADAIADAITMVDGLVVIGGGLAGAHEVFLDTLVGELNKEFTTLAGEPLSRLETTAFNLEDPQGLKAFLRDTSVKITVPFGNRKVNYDAVKEIGIGVSVLGTSRAVAIGAYNFALDRLNSSDL
jgi:glucokinase